MEKVYSVIGFIVFWFIAICFCIYLLVVFYYVFSYGIKRAYQSDKYMYYFGRVFPTSSLRMAYQVHSDLGPKYKRLILKYRLRNIKLKRK